MGAEAAFKQGMFSCRRTYSNARWILRSSFGTGTNSCICRAHHSQRENVISGAGGKERGGVVLPCVLWFWYIPDGKELGTGLL